MSHNLEDVKKGDATFHYVRLLQTIARGHPKNINNDK